MDYHEQRLKRLRPITDSDASFLYILLIEREPEMNISHTQMPTWLEHRKFINNHPYFAWYVLITSTGAKAGSIYLTFNDEIGIQLLKKYQGNGLGQQAVMELMYKNPRKQYFANINPKNKKSQKFFRMFKFHCVQWTYRLDYNQSMVLQGMLTKKRGGTHPVARLFTGGKQP